jgi:hypothetical protein
MAQSYRHRLQGALEEDIAVQGLTVKPHHLACVTRAESGKITATENTDNAADFDAFSKCSRTILARETLLQCPSCQQHHQPLHFHSLLS